MFTVVTMCGSHANHVFDCMSKTAAYAEFLDCVVRASVDMVYLKYNDHVIAQGGNVDGDIRITWFDLPQQEYANAV